MYISKCGKNIIIINLKVCYSTFEELKRLGYVSIYTIDKETINNCNIYIIVRDPIKKIISFYKDKILLQIKEYKLFNQYCTQELLLFHEKEDIISDNFTISTFIDCMKKGYFDNHIMKQCLHYNKIKEIYSNNINIIKLEDPNFNNILSNILNIDINIMKNTHNNKTDDIKLILSNDEILFLKEYYDEDYKLFQY